MNYEVKSIEVFERQAKRLVKKYISLKDELFKLVDELKNNPKQGIALGNNCYKIRISISAKGKGKRGGARIITNVVVRHSTIYMLSIYDKTEKDNISDDELKEYLKFVPD